MKLLIIDDHAVVREGISAVVRQAWPGAEVLQAASSSAGLAITDVQLDIDLVLLDLLLPDSTHMSALEAFTSRRADLPIVILSSSEEPEDVRRALSLGALGYVPKSAAAATLVAALRLVLAGEVYVPPFMIESGIQPSLSKAIAELTTRQLDVLRLVDAELSNKQIAYQLKISEKTVKTHLTAIFKVLGVSDRGQAAKIARLEH